MIPLKNPKATKIAGSLRFVVFGFTFFDVLFYSLNEIVSHSLSASQSFGSILSLLVSVIVLIATIVDLSRLFYKNSLHCYRKNQQAETGHAEVVTEQMIIFKPNSLQDQFYIAGTNRGRYEYFLVRFTNSFNLLRFVLFSVIITVFQTQSVIQVFLLCLIQISYLVLYSAFSFGAKSHSSVAWMIQKSIVEALITTTLVIFFAFSLDKYGSTFSSNFGELLQLLTAFLMTVILFLEGGAFILFTAISAFNMNSQKELGAVHDIRTSKKSEQKISHDEKVKLKIGKNNTGKSFSRKVSKERHGSFKDVNKASGNINVEEGRESPENQLL